MTCHVYSLPASVISSCCLANDVLICFITAWQRHQPLTAVAVTDVKPVVTSVCMLFVPDAEYGTVLSTVPYSTAQATPQRSGVCQAVHAQGGCRCLRRFALCKQLLLFGWLQLPNPSLVLLPQLTLSWMQVPCWTGDCLSPLPDLSVWHCSQPATYSATSSCTLDTRNASTQGVWYNPWLGAHAHWQLDTHPG